MITIHERVLPFVAKWKMSKKWNVPGIQQSSSEWLKPRLLEPRRVLTVGKAISQSRAREYDWR